MASVVPVSPQERHDACLARSADRPVSGPVDAATPVLRELVLAAVSEQGWAATWLAGPRGLVEGAETKEQVDVLRELGCHQIQGYYFSRPLTPESVPGFAARRI